MVFRHEAPEARVGGVVAVVALHPVVVQFKGIRVRDFAIYIDFAAAHFKAVALVHADRPLVNRQVGEREVQRFAFLRNPQRPVVGRRPVLCHILRIEPARIGHGAAD